MVRRGNRASVPRGTVDPLGDEISPGRSGFRRVLAACRADAVVTTFEAATDESPETRELLRAKLTGRNEVMDAMMASLQPHLRVPEAQAVYRALVASGVYRELVEESGWAPRQFQGLAQRRVATAPVRPTAVTCG